jgi:hypothetical protein
MAIQLLNSRFERGHPVAKCNSDNPSKVDLFDPFGPTCFSSRNRFSDASLESRCLDIVCEETENSSIPAIVNPEQFEKELGPLRDDLYVALRVCAGFPQGKSSLALGDVPKRFQQLLLAIYQALPAELDGEFAKLLADLREQQKRSYGETDEGVIWESIFEESQKLATTGTNFILTGEFVGGVLELKETSKAKVGGKRLSAMGFTLVRNSKTRAWICSKKMWEKNAIRLGLVPPPYPWEGVQIKLKGEESGT